MQQPVGWIESPHGKFRRNYAFKLQAPQTVAWSIPVYFEPPSAVDVVREVIEELDHVKQQYHFLASEMVYEGNSVQHWCQKARAYKEALGEAWKALAEAGVHPDGNTSVADGIRKLKGQV
jgi:hypothetical protein